MEPEKFEKTEISKIGEALHIKNFNELDLEFKNGEICTAIPKVMKDIKAVGKNQKVESRGNGPSWKFRGIDDVYNAVQKAMSDNNVFCVPKILKRERTEIKSAKGTKGTHARYEYRYRFFAKDGSWVDAFTDGEAIDWADKVSNKVASFAHKYALLQIFCIPTEDLSDDPDKQNHDQTYKGGQAPPTNQSKNAVPKDKKLKKIQELVKVAKEKNWPNTAVTFAIERMFKKKSSQKLTIKECDDLIDMIQKNSPEDAMDVLAGDSINDENHFVPEENHD